jgi:hypothetical protein
MRKISSRLTFWYARILPLVLFGFVGAWTLFWRERAPLIFFLFPGVMAVVLYFTIRLSVFPLADEVFLEEDEVIVRKNGKEIRFSVRQIMNVESSMRTNPERITLTLREDSELGREIVFSPPYRFFHFFSRHPIAQELIAKSNGIEWSKQ